MNQSKIKKPLSEKTVDELRAHIITLDGKGKEFKNSYLNELLRRVSAGRGKLMTEKLIHEDELPDDMTQKEYDEWYKKSYIPGGVGCRVGVRPEKSKYLVVSAEWLDAIEKKYHDIVYDINNPKESKEYIEAKGILAMVLAIKDKSQPFTPTEEN